MYRTFHKLIIGLIFFQKDRFLVFYLQNVHAAVRRDLSVPEIPGFAVSRLKQRPYCTSVGSNQNGFFLIFRNPYQFIPEFLGSSTNIPDTFSSFGGLKGKGHLEKSFVVLSVSAFHPIFNTAAFHFSEINLPDTFVCIDGNLSSFQNQPGSFHCPA